MQTAIIPFPTWISIIQWLDRKKKQSNESTGTSVGPFNKTAKDLVVKARKIWSGEPGVSNVHVTSKFGIRFHSSTLDPSTKVKRNGKFRHIYMASIFSPDLPLWAQTYLLKRDPELLLNTTLNFGCQDNWPDCVMSTCPKYTSNANAWKASQSCVQQRLCTA